MKTLGDYANLLKLHGVNAHWTDPEIQSYFRRGFSVEQVVTILLPKLDK